MTFIRIRLILALVMLLAIASIAAAPARAQKFPSKPIHVILPFAVGGLLDATVRAIGQSLSQSVGQPVLVENKPGGGTFIGMEACARATPDGYTICITTPDSLVYNPYLYTQVPYDAEKDFVPVTNLVFINSIIVAAGNAPFNTFKEMIAYAKANPGKVTWATWGAGSIPHVYLEAVTHAFNVDILQVPYKGAGQAYPAVLSGEAQVTYGGLGFSMAQIKEGKLKPLAMTPDPSPLVPGVPTMKELGAEPGLPGYFGVWAPAKTPAAIVDTLVSEIAKTLEQPKIKEFLVAQTLIPVGNSPAEFAAFVANDRIHAREVFNSMGLKPSAAP
jgi:tripartite-type tricarboxylate transporter receptor subunit TctC